MGELAAELNRLAGTTNLDAQGAANAWAGTTGRDLVGALNTKAGTSGVGLNGVLKLLSSTTLDSNGSLVGYSAVTTLASDNFNRANGELVGSTPQIGSAWAGTIGLFAVETNRLANINGSNDNVRLSVGQANHKVTSLIFDLPSANFCGLMCRHSDDNNFYAADISADGTCRFLKRVGGSFGVIGSNASAGFVATDTIAFYVNGSSLTAYRNGVSVLTATDTDLATGNNAGFWYNSTGGSGHFDNFVVTSS